MGAHAHAPTRHAVAPRPPHVLIVEDDSDIRKLVAYLLQDAGYAVLQASDGFEAIQHLRQTRPDLIVLDLMLPRMSGWQFLEQARPELDRAKNPVVILSAISGWGDYPSALGVAGWPTKPIDTDRFLCAVEDRAPPGSSSSGSVSGRYVP